MEISVTYELSKRSQSRNVYCRGMWLTLFRATVSQISLLPSGLPPPGNTRKTTLATGARGTRCYLSYKFSRRRLGKALQLLFYPPSRTIYTMSSQHPVLSRLLASNAQWAQDVKRVEPDFFVNCAKGQAPKVRAENNLSSLTRC